MKNLIYLLLFIAVLSSCNSKQEAGYELHGKVEGMADCKAYLLLRKYGEVIQYDTIATTFIKDGEFTLKGNLPSATEAHIAFDSSKYWCNLIMENAKLELVTKESSFWNPIVTGGKGYHDKVFNFFSRDSVFVEKQNQMNKIEKRLSKLRKERIPKDTLQKVIYERWLVYKAKNERGVSLKYDVINASNDHVFKMLVLQKYKGKAETVEPYLKEAKSQLGENHFLISDIQKRAEYVLNKRAEKKRMENRSKFIDFTVQDINGKEQQLGEVLKKNKYVLLEFWASWCKPCRAEVPNIVKAYEKYHSKGFEVFSFSLDHKKDQWIKASKHEELKWINTTDLQGRKSPVVLDYAVQGIPDNFLIDQNGKIIARELRGEKLHTKLKDLFKEIN